MSDAPDFRLENSELRGEDEFTEFTDVDLPYYSGWQGSFEKLPWAAADEALPGAAPPAGEEGARRPPPPQPRPGPPAPPRSRRETGGGPGGGPPGWGGGAPS